MCRLAAYSGPPLPLAALTHTPTHSLVVQSYKPKQMREALLNADGVGAVLRAVWGGGALRFDGLLAFGIGNDEAAGAVAAGGSGQAGGGEGEMQQAALAGVHGREGVGAAGGTDALGSGLGD